MEKWVTRTWKRMYHIRDYKCARDKGIKSWKYCWSRVGFWTGKTWQRSSSVVWEDMIERQGRVVKNLQGGKTWYRYESWVKDWNGDRLEQ